MALGAGELRNERVGLERPNALVLVRIRIGVVLCDSHLFGRSLEVTVTV